MHMLTERAWLISGLLPSFLALALFDTLHEAFGVGFERAGHVDDGYFIIGFTTVLAYFCLVAFAYFIKYHSESLETEKGLLNIDLDQSNKALVERNKELEKLKDTIQANSVYLQMMNQRLEERVALRTEELEKVIADLEERNAEMERFTYTVSHDLKSPLVTIMGFLGYLEKDLDKGNINKAKDDMAHISTASRRMLALLEDLLDLSRVGRVNQPRTVFSMEELAAEAKENLNAQIKDSGATITIEAHLNRIYADRQRIGEMLQNLIENAIKFSQPGRPPIIKIGSTKIENERLFYLKDNGIGIPTEYLEKIFGLFERLDHEIEGTGVGLAIVRRIVEVNQGRIWASSEGPNQGTTFYFSLPTTTEA